MPDLFYPHWKIWFRFRVQYLIQFWEYIFWVFKSFFQFSCSRIYCVVFIQTAGLRSKIYIVIDLDFKIFHAHFLGFGPTTSGRNVIGKMSKTTLQVLGPYMSRRINKNKQNKISLNSFCKFDIRSGRVWNVFVMSKIKFKIKENFQIIINSYKNQFLSVLP